MAQKAICVSPVPLNDTHLDLAELQAALDDGFKVATTEASTTGSILVIVDKSDN